jgi:ankyrin repeat protein
MQNNAVIAAIHSGDLEALGCLLAENPTFASARDATGVSAIMHALYRRQNAALERLLAANPELDVFEATSLGKMDDLTELLRRDPSSAKAFSTDGFTSLHFAAFFSQPRAAELLLKTGAEVNAISRNSMQVMSLHSAAAVRSVPVAKLLLEHGASPNARQQGGWTPLHAAAQHGDLPMAQLLLKFEADKSVMNDDGLTAAAVARKFDQPALIELL